MNSKPENQITIVVEGGMVTEVYANLPADAELEILDFDCVKVESPDKSEAMEKRLEKIKRKQNKYIEEDLRC